MENIFFFVLGSAFARLYLLLYEPVLIRTLYEQQMRNASKNPPATQAVVRHNGLGRYSAG